MFTSFVLMGAIMGFMGTVIETLSYSVSHKKFKYRGDDYFWGSPIKPIYALGGLLMFFCMELTRDFPWYWSILLSSLTVIVWEYLSGVFCMKVLGERLWNYYMRKLNIDGHICWWSAKWWLIITSLFYFFLYDRFANLDNLFRKSMGLSTYEDLIVTLLTIGFILSLTVVRKEMRNIN